MTAKIMELVDPSTGEMKCPYCGHRHWAQVKPDSNGKFYRGTWQCSECNGTGIRIP